VRLSIFVFALLATTAPASAQESAPDPNRDTLSIGLAGAMLPRYEGSGDYKLIPAAAIRGKVSGVSFITQGTALFVDIVPSSSGPGTKFNLGPMAHVTLNRSSLKTVRDPQIVALGRIPVAVEVGGHVGVTRTGLITSDYDSLNIDVAVSHDVTGIHDSLIVSPSITYGTPLSRKAYVGAVVSADHVGSRYARTYFGVSPTQSLASGLSPYNPGQGFKTVNAGVFGNVSLTGDLLGGLSAFAIGNYSKLLGEFGRSPVVRERNQWFGGLGLAYTF
jgi:outer membrane scaffolding protein for murein synthesis (MipA/OmpV family)